MAGCGRVIDERRGEKRRGEKRRGEKRRGEKVLMACVPSVS
jgi:hypothetical protein